MARQDYSTVESRNLIRAEMRMLRHAAPIQVLGNFGSQKTQPLRKTDTVVFRRVQPFNATAVETPDITVSKFVTSEGVTPTPNTIAYTDVTVSLVQYAVLFKFSSKVELMYEDDIPGDMSKITGETMAEVAELVCYGQIKAGTSVTLANGSTRGGLTARISLNKLRQCARTLETNRAMRVTTKVAPGPDFGTTSVEPTFLVFIHTDVESDVRELTGFARIEDYGSAVKPVHAREIGKCEQFRFVTSPLFAPYLAAGGTPGTTGMLDSTESTTALDVYPCIVCAEDAWGHISLKGHNYSGVSPTLIPSSIKNHANPMGMYGFVGADFWYNSFILNQNWMTRLEVCVTDLDN